MSHTRNYLIILFILLGVFTRLIPHPPNFTAIGSIAVFSGAFFYNKKIACLLPIIIMWISDIILGYDIIWSVYLSFLIIVCLGFTIQKNQSLLKIINISILASIVFFIITNLAVYISSPLYQKNILGLIECYTLAIPFFFNTLSSQIIYSSIMFVGFNTLHNAIIVKSK